MPKQPPGPLKGRGAVSNPVGRFETRDVEAYDDGWYRDPDDAPGRPPTVVMDERVRSLITYNDSPDVGFDRAINPYRGCEHGCSYCYARPNHAYLNLSPGLDFETKLFAKVNAAAVLREELAKPGYACNTIHIGGVTDPYQPIEKRYRLTRAVLEVLAETRHPLSIITKNAAVVRDLDLYAAMARDNLCRVYLSITSLDNALSAKLEPRASAPHARLRAVEQLAAAGVPTGIMVAPVIPFVTDEFMERILERGGAAGARGAGYVLLRLPHEVKQIFREWLDAHYPDRAERVMAVVRDAHGGRDYTPQWGTRQTGQGAFAELFAQRFARARRAAGLDTERAPLRTDLFRPPPR
ncbi:MAG TPA: PA0069 family radical SAM protein, partial [Xanthomonadales bacterium]|nr:PA0069 family radical SAM protein [Xanthomonadales bacterium]